MLGITNDIALGAQNHLKLTQQAQESSQERLASGKRINSAADDAASSALISQFAAQIAGNTQGVRNINDGVSLAQTAEGGVSQINDTLLRMRELSVQSLNGTLSGSDRAAIQSEIGELQEQVSQTMESTTFNGIQLLRQETPLSLRAGSEADDSITLDIGNVRDQLSTLGVDDIDLSTAAGAASALDALDQAGDYINGVMGTLGAAQNRFESTLDTLADRNLSAVSAQSRIQDTDYASETAEQTRNQILRQANIAMTAQANASSQQVLQLLGGG